MRYFTALLILGMFCLVTIEPALAQCPMCKAAAESSLKEGSQAAAGLNSGIFYLFFTPYLLLLSLAGLWYWNYRRNKALAGTR